jgi:hypothetical protein
MGKAIAKFFFIHGGKIVGKITASIRLIPFLVIPFPWQTRILASDGTKGTGFSDHRFFRKFR